MLSVLKKVIGWIIIPPKKNSKILFIGLMSSQLLLVVTNIVCIAVLHSNGLLTKYILCYFVLQIAILLIGFGSYLAVYLRRLKSRK